MIENPPWVTKLLNKHWDTLTELVGREMMPIGTEQRGKIVPQEYGTGHYGTVMPTEDGHRVIKITSDVTEAVFVAAAMHVGDIPRGLVRYERIVALPDKHRGRPVFVLWREEAFDVGFLAKLGSGKLPPEAGEARRFIGDFFETAAIVRDAVKKDGLGVVEKAKRYEDSVRDWVSENYDLIGKRAPYPHERASLVAKRISAGFKGPQRVAVSLRFLEVIAETMEHSNPLTVDLGRTFEFYLERGILLADVHPNNIGKAMAREYGDEWEVVKITDPGHAVFLTAEYDGIEIMTLPEPATPRSRSRR